MTVLHPFAAGMFAPMRNTDRLVAMKASLDDLQRQVGTGKVSETLGGLGFGRTTSLSVRAGLAETAGFRGIVQRAEVRAGLMASALDRITAVGDDARRDAVKIRSGSTAVPPAAAQRTALARLDTVISALNEDFDGQYLFAGGQSTVKPVLTSVEILGGAGGAAGLGQLVEEQRAADLGNGLGRLAVAAGGTSVSMAEEAAGLPFGLKIGSVASGLSQSTAVTAGSPSTFSLTFTGQPQPGEALDIRFGLPDGTTAKLTLTASATGAGPGSFQIGVDPAATATNLAAALEAGVREVAATSLSAASATVAATDFFAATSTTPARRVEGPPFATATGYAAPGSRPTILWYRGEDGAGDARETQRVQVDRGLHLSVGARANEVPLRTVMAGLAAMAAGPAPSNAAYSALAERAGEMVQAMSSDAGRALVIDIGSARMQMASVLTRHNQRDAILQGALGEVENASIEQLSVEIVTLQTRLQASYQVTASISRLNLADYLR